MTHTYNISGMTCNGCVANVKSELLKLGDITAAEVQLGTPQATLSMQKHIPITSLQNALKKAGNFNITEADEGMHHVAVKDEPPSTIFTYKPILILGAYITGITLLIEYGDGRFNGENWMQNFMGAFFLAFSFFKLLDLKGFAESYSTYDIIAKKWLGWGYVYAFIELGLGIAYLLKFLAFGEGDTAPVTREVLRQAEPDPSLRSSVRVARRCCHPDRTMFVRRPSRAFRPEAPLLRRCR